MAKKSKGTIGILTGGGDCPGLNAVIRAVVRRAEMLNYRVVGIKNGWQGLVKGVAAPLSHDSVSGILPRGGTILGTSRTNPLKTDESKKKLLANLKKLKIDYIIAVGGEDTLGVARKLAAEKIKVVGVPKTIDNDVEGTDQTFGFDTAVSIVTEAIDRLHSTAESHQRVMVVEVPAGLRLWAALRGARTVSSSPRSPRRSRRSVTSSRNGTRGAGSSPSWWWPRGSSLPARTNW